jgi:hypothetical protein
MRIITFRLFFLLFSLFLQIKGISQVDNKIDSVVPLKNYFGINIGLRNNIHSAVIDGKKFISYNQSLVLGENFTTRLNKWWNLTVQANVQIGSYSKNNFYARGESYSYQLYRTVIDLPIIFRYLLNNNKKNKSFGFAPHFIQFGPVFSYNLMANKTIRFNQYGNNSRQSVIPGFENGYNNSFRIGTGYSFKSKYAFIRAELNYDYDFNSLKKNTIPLGNLTKVSNDAIGVNFVVESRSKVIRKKGRKAKIGRVL